MANVLHAPSDILTRKHQRPVTQLDVLLTNYTIKTKLNAFVLALLLTGMEATAFSVKLLDTGMRLLSHAAPAHSTCFMTLNRILAFNVLPKHPSSLTESANHVHLDKFMTKVNSAAVNPALQTRFTMSRQINASVHLMSHTSTELTASIAMPPNILIRLQKHALIAQTVRTSTATQAVVNDYLIKGYFLV